MKQEASKIENAKKILFVPRIEKGKGGGHFIRSALFVEELLKDGIEAYIYVSKEMYESPMMRQLSHLAEIDSERIVSFPAEKKDWSFIILDNFQSSEAEYVYWENIAPVLAIDEGGLKRDAFDFLIDILPGLKEKSKANISRPNLLRLPKNRRPCFAEYTENNSLKVLFVFGAEDASSMGLSLAKSFSSMKNIFTYVICNNTVSETLPPNVKLIQPLSNLREELYNYDLVVTHYGITAYEALYARVPVFIVSPTHYHEKLAKETGFISLGTKDQALKALQNAEKKHYGFRNAFMKKSIAASKNIALTQGLDAEQTQSLIDIIKNADCTVPKSCPVCGASSLNHPVVARFEDRTYRCCKQCSMEYMLRLNDSSIQYTEDYFFSEYKKQYGKTYLEDFPHLVETAKNRLSHIKNLLHKTKPSAPSAPFRLLDIGCAYGPFLKAAQDEGFEVFGIDPSWEAVNYVNETLGISALQGFFPDIDLPQHILKDGFDVISLWYVIEHFENPQAAVKKISSWLKPGGVLAFSTPSGTGISARRNRQVFLEKSPADHWTIWKPMKTRNALKPHHIDVKKIVITGHHPERFPFIYKTKGFLYHIVYILSKYFKLGDTYETYTIKQ